MQNRKICKRIKFFRPKAGLSLWIQTRVSCHRRDTLNYVTEWLRANERLSGLYISWKNHQNITCFRRRQVVAHELLCHHDILCCDTSDTAWRPLRRRPSYPQYAWSHGISLLIRPSCPLIAWVAGRLTLRSHVHTSGVYDRAIKQRLAC